MLYCHCSEIFNNIWARGTIFLFFTVSHKLWNWSQIRDSSMLWCVAIIHSTALMSNKYPILWIYCNLFIYSTDNFFVHSYLTLVLFQLQIKHLWTFVDKASLNCLCTFVKNQCPYMYRCISEISILFYSSICLYTSTTLTGLSYSYEKFEVIWD